MNYKSLPLLALALTILFLPALFSCGVSQNQNKALIWQFTAPRQMQWSGYGIALSPQVEGDYVVYAAGYHWQNQVYLFVVDQNSGALVWKSEESIENFKVSGDYVLATTREFIHKKQPGKEREIKINCFKLDSGELAWSHKSKVVDFEPRILSGGDNFYLWMPGLELYALRKVDGKILWRMQRSGNRSPLATSTMYADGDTIYSATPKLAVAVFNGITGKVEKLISLKNMPRTLVSKMELFKNNLVLFGKSGILTIIDLDKEKVVYQDQIGTTSQGIKLADGRIYCGSAFKTDDNSTDYFLNCVDLKKKTVLWKRQFLSNITLAPLVEGNDLYLGTTGDDKFFYCLDAETGKVRWKKEIGPIKDKPLIDDGVVYVAGQSAFLALDGQSGDVLFSKRPSQYNPASGPVLGTDKIIFVGQDSNLYAYKLMSNPGTKSTSGRKSQK